MGVQSDARSFILFISLVTHIGSLELLIGVEIQPATKLDYFALNSALSLVCMDGINFLVLPFYCPPSFLVSERHFIARFSVLTVVEHHLPIINAQRGGSLIMHSTYFAN